jgi:nitrite reductase (NADH) large subunit
MLKQLLAEAGVVQSKALCEHFGHSRAELFEVVQVSGIQTFSELLAEHGKGTGCDICKPAVASVLASLGNGHVLDGEQASLQDTNDHFLANLQRNCTYSVVPRIPGGEITPAKLMVIAEVARDFGLYTKITGGQRIDLFGATVDELPEIWRRLVGAGMESGHAYGKALRTVKSRVGTTDCSAATTAPTRSPTTYAACVWPDSSTHSRTPTATTSPPAASASRCSTPRSTTDCWSHSPPPTNPKHHPN